MFTCTPLTNYSDNSSLSHKGPEYTYQGENLIIGSSVSDSAMIHGAFQPFGIKPVPGFLECHVNALMYCNGHLSFRQTFTHCYCAVSVYTPIFQSESADTFSYPSTFTLTGKKILPPVSLYLVVHTGLNTKRLGPQWALHEKPNLVTDLGETGSYSMEKTMFWCSYWCPENASFYCILFGQTGVLTGPYWSEVKGCVCSHNSCPETLQVSVVTEGNPFGNQLGEHLATQWGG